MRAVDADDILHRLFRQRRYLALFAIALAVAAFVFFDRKSHPTYNADARLVLGPELSSTQEAQTVVSRAQGVATTTDVLATAIRQANVSRSADQVRGEVAVSGIGDSGLAKLTVTDRDPGAAAALCRAVAAATVAFINRTNTASIQSTLDAIQSELNQQLAGYAQLQAASGTESAAAQLAAISENINALSSARGQLLARQAQLVPAAVVDQPLGSGTRNGSNRLTVGGLIAVGALLVWLLLAFAAEALRPTYPTLRSVARAFDAPVLGRLRANLAADDAQTAVTLARLELSAQHLRADTLVVGGRCRSLAEFVHRLDEVLHARARTAKYTASGKALAAAPELVLGRTGRARGAADLGDLRESAAEASMNGASEQAAGSAIPRRALAMQDAQLAPATGTGIVIVAYPGIARSAMSAAEDLVRCTYWPVLGVLEVRPARRESGPR